MPKFINLTTHIVNETISGKAFPPSGKVARVSETPVEIYKIENDSIGIPVFTTTYGVVEDLPNPEENTIFIVSGQVRTQVKHRKDVLSPGDLVRNDAGQPIGCKGFKSN